MEQKENQPRLAQPADEEIKKHGDQMAKQVRDAAGRPVEENLSRTEQQTGKE